MMDGSHLYEHLVTQALGSLIRSEPPERVETRLLDQAESPELLARHLAQEVAGALQAVAPERRVELINHMLCSLKELAPPGPPLDVQLEAPARLLLSRHHGRKPARTNLPFSISTVLTRSRSEPALGHELLREIETADRIDALISFVTMGGVRALLGALEAHARSGRTFRLLTTTYTGATDAKAIELLASLPGVDVRVSYDARRTRLPAKAWLFTRESGLDTAYVGSANLSSSALFHGHEWMVKIAAADMAALIHKIRGTFETLWNDGEFEPYDPTSEHDQIKLRAALAQERGGGPGHADQPLRIFFDLRPYPYQLEILDRLEVERTMHHRRRNLVVAATGTGKTVIAAFDYARQRTERGTLPRLLFLAHREELLRQALVTFRHVLHDGSFGSVLSGGSAPDSVDHLFATVQSFNSRNLLERHGADYWDHVVIDECHHAPADSYRALVERLRPTTLIGLTATPERTDGQSLLPDFDGVVAAEIRLWHALERQLLVPFEYYGISDNTDLRQIRWSRGAYQSEDLEKLYTGDDRRAALVIKQTARQVGNPQAMRALGFCVSVAHAEFMAEKFRQAGIPAIALHGMTSPEERLSAPRRLEQREVNVIFTCDLYNEGVDLPFVDTLLLLRPTESATLFMQQLGRGLRLHDAKVTCLVLDFIGQHREEFRFDKVLSAMTGLGRGALRAAVETGFPLLPTGCHLQLDRVAREQILAGLQRSLRGGLQRLVAELRSISGSAGPDLDLRMFLAESGRDLAEVFNAKLSWSQLRQAVGLPCPPDGPQDHFLRGKIKQILHLDDPVQLAFFRDWLTRDDLILPNDPLASRRALMLAYQLFHEPERVFSVEAFTDLLRQCPATVDDMRQVIALLQEKVAISAHRPAPGLDWPLLLHHRYHRREVLAAIGRWDETKKPPFREGVLRLESDRCELLFITLDKCEERFSSTTRYEDYAISDTLFHWQTQSTVTTESESGRRYIEQASNGWRFVLFVRATIQDAYTYLGPARYEHHEGSRPMSITWRLENPMPGKWLDQFLSFAA